MSTPFRDEQSPMLVIPCGKQIVVSTGRGSETLADYVRRVRTEKALSLEDVSKMSGGRIGRSHINRIENGLSTSPSPQRLQALAKGLGVSEEEVFAAARGKTLSEAEA